MVKRKHSATKKPGTSDSASAEGSGKRPMTEADEEPWERREREERKEKKAWIRKMKTRGFTCERELKRDKLENHPVVQAVQRHGLSSFFEPGVRRYRKELVRSFYENMVLHRERELIASQWERGSVEITPDTIAHYLHYRRPDYPSYPEGDWAMAQDEQIRTLTDHPDSFRPAGNGKYAQGKLRSEYRTFNKLIHYNLHPFSLEKTPTRHDGEVLVVFGSEDARVDWAKWIWEEMVTFRRKGTANGNIPFPAMITKFCEDARCKPAAKDILIRGTPGPIHGGTVKKSASASRAPRIRAQAESLPTSSSRHERNEEWHKIQHARQTVLLGNQRKIVTNQGRMMKMLRWLVTCESKRSGEAYEDSEPELEALDDFEEAGIEVEGHGSGRDDDDSDGGGEDDGSSDDGSDGDEIREAQ